MQQSLVINNNIETIEREHDQLQSEYDYQNGNIAGLIESYNEMTKLENNIKEIQEHIDQAIAQGTQANEFIYNISQEEAKLLEDAKQELEKIKQLEQNSSMKFSSAEMAVVVALTITVAIFSGGNPIATGSYCCRSCRSSLRL